MTGKNKKAALSAAVILIAGIAGRNVMAAGSEDYARLLKVFQGKEAAAVADDINGDGKLNIIDLITFRAGIDEKPDTGTVADGEYRAVAENVKLTGRTYDDGKVIWLVQSGSAVEFDITASEASVVIAGDSAVENEEKYRPRYAVFVDDKLVEDVVMGTKTREVNLLSEKTQKTVRVKIIHLSEANNGAVGVQTVKAVSSAAKPLKPAAKKDLSIEFIGDSITCAYGVEGKSNGDQFMTATENFMKSYAYIAAQKLGADYSAVSYSGHGIISGYSSGSEKETASLVPDYYENIAKSEEYAKPWNFADNKNDVVFINLGTNDDTYIRNDTENRLPEFEEGYYAFLQKVRKNNPDAYIICTVGTMGCEEVYPAIENAVKKFSSADDSRIMCYLSATQKPENGYGSDWHPSEITQQMSAYVAADKICEALGIESDKIGLDAAAGAKYDAVINTEAGANASTYLGYDNSYWVNMVGGGKEKSDVQIVVSSMELSKGKYTLKFAITAGKETEIPVSVESSSGKKYCDDSLKAGTDKLVYEKEIEISDDLKDGRLVLGVGGTDYYNVTLSSLSLVKTENLK